jgi:hypothetical protein
MRTPLAALLGARQDPCGCGDGRVGRAAGMRRLWLRGVTVIVALSATVALAGKAPIDYLDEQTGATISVVGQPLVFAHDRANAPGPGDYVTLAAAAVDQSGNLGYVLIKYCWSVGAVQASVAEQCAAAPLLLQADGRSIELPLRQGSARDAGIGVAIHRPPFGAATPSLYSIDLPTMRFISECHHLTLRVGGTDPAFSYELFEDRLSSLREFVRHQSANN